MAENQDSYLYRLKFDPKLLSSWHAKYIQNVRVVVLLILIILAVGITALLTLPRRLNPEVKLTIVTVSTVLPGAGPQDVESLITMPLEDKLQGLDGLDTLSSMSRESISVISMQFKSGVVKDKARNDAQTAVSEVTTLPGDAQIPRVVALDFENQPIWVFSLSSQSDTASLMRFSEDLKTKIEDLPNIDQVSLSGIDTQEIQVVMDQAKIREYNINPLQVSQAVKTATNSFPAGSVQTTTNSFALSIDTQAASIDEIRNIHLNFSGTPLKLGDVAQIYERSKPNQSRAYYANSTNPVKRTVILSIFKTSTADIDKTIKNVEKYVNSIITETEGAFTIQTVSNSGEEISKQLTDLVGEFQSTILLVFINLSLFLGVRQALIAGMTIPITFLLSFVWMGLLGQTINFITLFSLLLAFGTSIDDTIVTVSAMTAYFRTGKFSPIETGLLVWRDFVVPIWTTTVTTVWAFLPLILSSGILGEFIKPIPIVVATTMYTSTAVAWFITLPMIIVLLKPNIPRRIKLFFQVLIVLGVFGFIIYLTPKTVLFVPTLLVLIIFILVGLKVKKMIGNIFKSNLGKNKRVMQFNILSRKIISSGLINTQALGEKYENVILRILSSKKGRRTALIAVGSFAAISYMLIPIGLVKNEFFPKTNADSLFVTLNMPSGTNIESLDKEAQNITEIVRRTPETEAVLSQMGVQGGFFEQSLDENSALITLILIPKEKRKNDSSVIASSLRKQFETYNKGKISITETSSGPPVGADVQIKLLGDDLSTLNKYAEQTISYLSKVHGVVNVDKTVKAGTSKLVFIPNRAELVQNGISLDTLGFYLRLAASGFTLDKIKFESRDEEDISFYANSGTLFPEDVSNITIPTQSGNVPLVELGNIKLKTNPTVIFREGGKRTMSVTAGVLPGYSISEINKNLEKFADTDLALTSGYNWQTGGVNEENQKSVTSILRAMGLSFILIMATMVIEFSSYRQAAMILSLIPFAISGVFVIFGLTGTPLSFPALIGVMALFGVVVTNAMFIVEKINQNRKEGMDLIPAIADAGRSRLEPILLTSITSILGLVPITLSNPLWRGLGGAIISGLLFSGGIMLIYIPVMYYTLNREKKNNE